MASVRPPRGFVDRNDEFSTLKHRILERLRGGYERYGFPFWETPNVESIEALLGGGESEAVKQIFYVRSPDNGEMDLGLRFDLTIPFARVAAGLIEAGHPLPLRRAEAGYVYRADKPGPGRVRQFTQFDVDIVGSPSPWADLEVLSALHFALGEGCRDVAGVGTLNIFTKVSSRRFLDALVTDAGIPDPATRRAVIRVIDKLDKLTLDDVHSELVTGRVDDESGAEIPGVGLPAQTADKVLSRLSALSTSGSRKAALDAASASIASDAGEAALKELAIFDSALTAIGLNDRLVEFDLSLARGLDYYTGLVFEVRVRGGEGASIAGGGRYDNLLERFSDVSVSGTGISIGIERLTEYLLAGQTDQDAPVLSRKILLGLPGVAADQLQVIANQLRNRGVSIELHLPEAGTQLRKQLAYANRGNYSYAVVVGPDELSNGVVSVKDLRRDDRSESSLSREEYRKQGTEWQETLSIEAAAAMLAIR